jgi:hypothetical protein
MVKTFVSHVFCLLIYVSRVVDMAQEFPHVKFIGLDIGNSFQNYFFVHALAGSQSANFFFPEQFQSRPVVLHAT